MATDDTQVAVTTAEPVPALDSENTRAPVSSSDKDSPYRGLLRQTTPLPCAVAHTPPSSAPPTLTQVKDRTDDGQIPQHEAGITNLHHDNNDNNKTSNSKGPEDVLLVSIIADKDGNEEPADRREDRREGVLSVDDEGEGEGDFTAEVLERELAALDGNMLDNSSGPATAEPRKEEIGSTSASTISSEVKFAASKGATAPDAHTSATKVVPDIGHTSNSPTVWQTAPMPADHALANPASTTPVTANNNNVLSSSQMTKDDLPDFISDFPAQSGDNDIVECGFVVRTGTGGDSSRPLYPSPAPAPAPAPAAVSGPSHAPAVYDLGPGMDELLSDLSWDEIEEDDEDEDDDGEPEIGGQSTGESEVDYGPDEDELEVVTPPAAATTHAPNTPSVVTAPVPVTDPDLNPDPNSKSNPNVLGRRGRPRGRPRKQVQPSTSDAASGVAAAAADSATIPPSPAERRARWTTSPATQRRRLAREKEAEWEKEREKEKGEREAAAYWERVRGSRSSVVVGGREGASSSSSSSSSFSSMTTTTTMGIAAAGSGPAGTGMMVVPTMEARPGPAVAAAATRTTKAAKPTKRKKKVVAATATTAVPVASAGPGAALVYTGMRVGPTVINYPNVQANPASSKSSKPGRPPTVNTTITTNLTTATNLTTTSNANANDPATKPTKTKKPKKPPKQHVCILCGKIFGRPSDLARHGAIHTGVRPFSCAHPGCGKAFIQRSALHVHLRTHTGEKPHACEYPLCNATFGDSSSLARHRRTHAASRPYTCAPCAKGFTRRGALTVHMRTAHDPEWELDSRVKYSFKAKDVLPQAGHGQGRLASSDENSEEESNGESVVGMPSLHALLDRKNENRPRMLPGSEAARARAAAAAAVAYTRNLDAGPAFDSTTGATAVTTRSVEDDDESDESDGDDGEEVDSAPTNAIGGPGDPVFEARIAALSAEITAAIVQAQVQSQTVLHGHNGGRFGGGEEEDEGGGEEEEGEEENDELEEDELAGEDEEVFDAASSVFSSVAPTSVHVAGPGTGAQRVYTYPPPPASANSTVPGSQPSRSVIVRQPLHQQHQSQVTGLMQSQSQKRVREMSAVGDSGRETEEDFPAPLRELKRKKLFVD